jgi:transcriptional regulator with XRE-family HTH domain
MSTRKPRSELALFLNALRRRIDRDVRALGPYVRLPGRVGKRVTQEEIAEAIGVCREWYAVLESAGQARASTRLLDRLADALMVAPAERARLFQLALPELGRTHLRDDSTASLEAFTRLRSLIKPLWAATSVDDVLTTATERIADCFEGAFLVHTARRQRPGVWESQPLDDAQDLNDASDLLREMNALSLTSETIDAAYLYPQLVNAGDVGTEDLHPLPLQHEVQKVVARSRLPTFSFLKGRVRSRSGLIAGISIWHESGHAYSASDRAVLGAVAELTSLALS